LISSIKRRLKSFLFKVGPTKQILTRKELLSELEKTPHWQEKIDRSRLYQYLTNHYSHAWIIAEPSSFHDQADSQSFLSISDRVHYGCGGNILDGWLNVDYGDRESEWFCSFDLLERHPLADSSVRLGFCEDVLEHFTQAESIFFLSEVFRTLKPGGVIRLSFPGLEGVLCKHYSPPSPERVLLGELEAYSFWDHLHFYSIEELRLVSSHLGFSAFRLVDYGTSAIDELSNLDTRKDQIGLNTYVELVK
jgi:predicted SAM-dependent methyltransferase